MYQPSNFIPKNTKINSWDDLKPHFDILINREISTKNDLETLIQHYSELISVFAEDYAWSYINMSCHTENDDYVKIYEIFASVIEPEFSKAANALTKKIATHPQFTELNSQRFGQLSKLFTRELEMFRDENVPLNAELATLSSQYDQVAGGLTANIDGEDLPMPMAGTRLLSADREVRKNAWLAMQESRYAKKEEFDTLYSDMVNLRHKVAINAGYENFRDFQHDNLHRFDYTPADAEAFHNAVETCVKPLALSIHKKHCEKLGLDVSDYRPWDGSGEPEGQTPLKPFEGGEELTAKAIDIFSILKPEFGENLKAMDNNKLFDLDSRKAKSPGGYNYPLEVTGMPFIFMNAAGTQRDVTTMMHEGGHAMHTFLCNEEPLVQYRGTPSEMAETASMSMELMTSPYWDKFYNKEDHIRARREHLEGIITFFPWCATVDALQHWVYLNPEHTTEERDSHFVELTKRFGTCVNWDGYEHYQRNGWQRQSHIFGVPFYYIEYGIAQLGALQVYRNFVKNNDTGLDGYIKGLKMGNSKPIPEVWENMGIKFDFSADTIKELMEFVQEELDKLDVDVCVAG
jgi:oligoendopeptidase F